MRKWTGADSDALDRQILAERGEVATYNMERPSDCLGCDKPFHPKGGPEVDGGVKFRARGMCVRCYEAARRESSKSA